MGTFTWCHAIYNCLRMGCLENPAFHYTNIKLPRKTQETDTFKLELNSSTHTCYIKETNSVKNVFACKNLNIEWKLLLLGTLKVRYFK